MRRLILKLFIILAITTANSKYNSELDYIRLNIKSQQIITPMEALDLIKEHYAANFERIYDTNSDLNYYYYKLASADYYLAYEGESEDGKGYLIHLYEFVIDEPDTGGGHTYTYDWFIVNKEGGHITEKL